MLKNKRRFSMSCRPEIRTMFARTRASLWSKVLERDRMAATHIFDAPPEGVAADWTMPQSWSAFTAEQHETWRSLFDRQSAEIGRAQVWTPVTNAHLVCRLLLE